MSLFKSVINRFSSVSLKFTMNGNCVFKIKRDPVSGKQEWMKINDNEANFFQDVARSAFADMLRDKERNVLYYQGLKSVIGQFKKSNPSKPVHVVDIGTGTGLLSMMAVESGADKVTAIEAFEPVAILARKIIDKNGYAGKVQVISKRSTDIDSDELVDKADIAVAEVFDTELIGENALQTFTDAQKNLLKPGARIVPSRAKVFAQLIESSLILDWNQPKPIDIADFGILIQIPDQILQCAGTDMVYDVQLNQVPRSSFQTVGEPFVVFDFDFEKPLPFESHKKFPLSIDRSVSKIDNLNQIDAVFTWWELDMDGTGSLLLSTKPDWDTLDNSKIIWRDHWIQNIHFLPKPLKNVKLNSEFWLFASHDEFSFWFNALEKSRNNKSIGFEKFEKPHCTCKLHQMLPRTNLARFNETERYRNYCQAFKSIGISGKKCINLGDCSLLPLIALQCGAKEVFTVEPEEEFSHIIREYARKNNLQQKLKIVEHIGLITKDYKADVIIIDPYFLSSFLPWHNLHVWRLVDDLRNFDLLAENVSILPNEVKLFALPVEFDHLWKIRAPAGTVEGFDLKLFDDIVQPAMRSIDAQVEPQPLWEYPSVALSEPLELLAFHLNHNLASQICHGQKLVDLPEKQCNALVFWFEWSHLGKFISSSGLEKINNDTQRPQWRKCYKQAVHFLPYPFRNGGRLSIDYNLDVLHELFDLKVDIC